LAINVPGLDGPMATCGRAVLAQDFRDGSWTECKQEYAALGGSTLVAMVQTANFREGNDITGRRRLYGTRPRAVLAERKMRSGTRTTQFCAGK